MRDIAGFDPTESEYWSQELFYEDREAPCYNGNISQMNIMQVFDGNVGNRYGCKYEYDALNRLTRGNLFAQDNNIGSGAFSETFTYDLNGNITKL